MLSRCAAVQSCLCSAGSVEMASSVPRQKCGNKSKAIAFAKLAEETIAALLAYRDPERPLMESSSTLMSATHRGLLLLLLGIPKMDCQN